MISQDLARYEKVRISKNKVRLSKIWQDMKK